jgi:hypothetical protein
MALSLLITLRIKEDDAAAYTIRRAMRISERPSLALKRIVNRYESILQNTPSPPAEYVDSLYTVFACSMQFRVGIDYPIREHVINLVRESTLPEEKIQSLITYLERISFVEYARLMEAVEVM